jgi:hypothetical protein
MRQWSTFAGCVRYEFLMQVRRRAMWIGVGLIAILLIFAFNNLTTPCCGLVPTHTDRIILWTGICNFLLTASAGLLLADRTPRDHKTRAEELLRTSPAANGTRMAGKYLGSVAATLMPIFLLYAVGIAVWLGAWKDVSILPVALAAFVTIDVPAVLFVGAFSIACTNVLWTPLYMFLFAGYWLWTSLNPGQAIPTLGGTLLSPELGYVETGFFHFSAFIPVDKGFYPDSSVGLGIANIGVLLGCGALALLAAWGWQRWQAQRQ